MVYASACQEDEAGDVVFEYQVQTNDVVTVVSVPKYMARLWTCAYSSQWGGGLYSMLQKTIRKDDGFALSPAIKLVRCLNGLVCSVRANPEASRWPSVYQSFRGTTMPSSETASFVPDKKYRVNMLLATSFKDAKAFDFMAEGMTRNPHHVPVLFRFHFDPVLRCKHVFYIEELTAVPGECEFLLVAYSAFKVLVVTPPSAGPPSTPLIIDVSVLPDNKMEPEDLPLQAWA
jgi:hypothetical protein